MNVSSVSVKALLTGKGQFTRFGSVGNVNLGGDSTIDHSALSSPILYSIKCILWDGSSVATLDVSLGKLETTTAEVRGVQQIESATAVGDVTTAGIVTVTVTAAGMTGTPKAISVAVAKDDTAAQWATKVRTALAADADVSAMFTVGSIHDHDIRLTRKEGTNGERYANDATLNIAYEDGTSVGPVDDATSDNTTAGVVSSGTQLTEGANGEDFEGNTIAMATVKAIAINRIDTGNTTNTVTVESEDGGTDGANVRMKIKGSQGAGLISGDVTYDLNLANSAGVSIVSIHVLGI